MWGSWVTVGSKLMESPLNKIALLTLFFLALLLPPFTPLAFSQTSSPPSTGNANISLAPKMLKGPSDLDPIYTYDANGNRTSMIDPTGITTYTYDALNRLTSITNNKGLTTTFSYDALGRRTSMTHVNGVATTYEYDTASQLTKVTHQLGPTIINSFTYAYDKVGNRITKLDRNGSYNYTYDTLYRLVQAVTPLPSNPLETYTYDPVGNRENSNQNGLSTFNAGNQLTQDSSFLYQYDANGNQIRKTSKATGEFTLFEYTAENQLVRAVSADTTINYKYDGLGRRVEKEVTQAGVTKVTRYIYDNEDILLELDGSNNIVARYTHGPGIDEPLIMERGGQSFFYHADVLGNISEITDISGNVVQRYTYSSFGKIESQLVANFVQPYTFNGREFDEEAQIYFYRTRYYDAKSGTFIQEDPLHFRGGDLNHYRYVRNNPTTYVDPTGLIVAQVVGGVIGAVVGGVSASFVPGATPLDVLQGVAVGAGAGVLSTIPIPGVNPILTGAAAGLLGNLGSQIFVENKSLSQLDAFSAGLSTIAGGVGGAVTKPLQSALSRTQLPRLTRESLEAFGSGLTSALTDVLLQKSVSRSAVLQLCLPPSVR